MAKLQISPIALPLIVPPPVIKTKNLIPRHAKTSEMTPFSAVAPARLLEVSSTRVQVHHEISMLDTIYEEEIYISTSITSNNIATITTTSNEDDDFVETAAFKSTPASLLSSTTCSFEVQKSLISRRSNFQYCAN